MNTLKFGNGEWYGKKDTILAYNDENSNFKPLPFNFERDTLATRVNKDGLIETVGSGEPRIDYKDDSKGALLLEPNRSNVLPYSSDFSQWSTASGASVVGNKLGVGGSNDAFEFFSDGTSSTRLFYAVSITGESSYSLFAKKNTLDYISLYANDDSNARVWFNLDNGTLGNQEGGGTGVIEDYGNGWYRCTLKWTSSNLVNVRIYNSNENDVVGGTAGSVYIQYAQLEQGSYPTSYIPTQGGVVTRVLDASSQTVPSNVKIENQGSLYFEFNSSYLEAYSQRILTISEDVSNLIEFQLASANLLTFVLVKSGQSGVVITKSAPSITLGENTKIAAAFSNGDFVFYVNGTLIGTDTDPSKSVPTISDIKFSRYNSTTAFIGSVNNLKLYNTRLSNAELQALTQI